MFVWDSELKLYELFDHSVKMTSSLGGNLSCFLDFERCTKFINTFRDNIIFYHDIFDTWDETVSLDTLNFGPDLGVDWFLCVEVDKEDVKNCSEYRLIIDEVPSLPD